MAAVVVVVIVVLVALGTLGPVAVEVVLGAVTERACVRGTAKRNAKNKTMKELKNVGRDIGRVE